MNTSAHSNLKRGLTTYILNRSEQFLQSFDLHDTYLVIDGSSIGCQLYTHYTKSNSAFGGDYDKYAECVRHFFWELKKCNIIPLVLIDGGYESRKSKTIMKRTRDKNQAAESFTLSNQNNVHYFPILMFYVFKNILKEMNIRHIQCLFEADNAIASVAKLLNCPLLSSDSDFYIYGALYIPFVTLENHVRKWRKYVKPCKIYKVETLLNTFSGLTESLLPLVATLLGNDYIQHYEFKNFYDNIKLPKIGRVNWNLQQCRIEAILKWLSKHTLNEAILLIIKTLPQENKIRTLRAIEMIINEYTSISINILELLGFSKENVDKIILQNIKNNCKFQTDISDLIKDLSKEFQDMNEFDLETINDAFINSLPSWFINEYCKVLLPNYFMNILMHKLYICPIQIEDYRQPSSIFISEKIINVIHTLLELEFEQTSKCSEYITRGQNNQLSHYPLKYIDNIGSYKIPSLHNLRKTPMNIRKEIYDNTLDIQHDLIVKFPENWRLYIATAKYWIDNLPTFKSDAHIYALLFAMLHHIIDSKIGYCRSIHTFKNKYKQKLETIESSKKLVHNKYSLLDCFAEKSIMEALNEIMEFDCLMLAPFFISNSDMNIKLQQNPKSYKRGVVHIFAQFQNCLKHSTDLNVLLGCPYQLTKVSDMFNGTLLYNLYNNFIKRKKIEDYIYCILQCSPNFCRLFHVILMEARLMFKLSV
ncbi:protein asteroid isoform X1 [Vespa crabro]|uniref:protein asteroid isoform X1 n=2 Tax=Vespa crabro TaxID=7445 RepID=UPI001F02741D|nr:protein asteroid isoform X1 [Vespa crabro]XP_046825214.1 protein asteroid isoform X1 [Vespa crabro]XP_046825215.1 protein asteroid isoform X1 [Vespa crabro]XP_046825216.1 protein asteroid isoform X1 [Vespa crabro]